MKTNHRASLTKDALLCTIMTFLVAGLLYLVFVNVSILDPFEKAFKDFSFTDVFYAERFNETERNQNIVLVNIKHADRFKLAEAIDKISQQNPKVIGLDIIFKDQKLAFTDSMLKAELTQNKNIVTAYFYECDSIVKNHAYFNVAAKKEGFINLNFKGQNTVIRDFLGVNEEGEIQYAFTTQMALLSGEIEKNYAIQKLNEPIPINYIGNKDAFLNFDIEEILSSEDIPALKGAMVIMGYLGDENPEFDIEDKHFTPLNKSWIGRAVPDTYGTTIHANILNMLTKKQLIYKVSNIVVYAIAFMSCFLLILLSMKLYKKNSFVFDLTKKLVQLVFSVVILYLALLLLQNNVYINVLPILLFALLGIEVMDFYEHLVIYLNKKFGWKSQLL